MAISAIRTPSDQWPRARWKLGIPRHSEVKASAECERAGPSYKALMFGSSASIQLKARWGSSNSIVKVTGLVSSQRNRDASGSKSRLPCQTADW